MPQIAWEHQQIAEGLIQHKMITTEEKINLLNDSINRIKEIISITEADILNNPEGDVGGKINRRDLLEDFIARKRALESELDSLDQM